MRDYFFAYIGLITKLGAPFARAINRLMRRPIVRKLVNQILDLAQPRALPEFALQTSRAFSQISEHEHHETVLFLRDTFTHFFEPDIERATRQVLDACGIWVINLPYFGAGRTLLSKGFIDSARRHAERLLNAINKLDPDGKLIVVGIEPSEIYTLRDEFLDLLPERRQEVEALASRAWLLEEFLVRPDAKSGTMRVAIIALENTPKPTQNTLLHGHCYQKAQPPTDDGLPIGQAASAELLRAVGYEVEIIPSGCCGMAGAFGYEKEHYELSMQVGELTLFPAISEAQKNNHRVLAVGTSCRTQIADGTDVPALHPIMLVAERLKSLENSR